MVLSFGTTIIVVSEEILMEMLQMFAINASESVMFIGGDGEEEEEEDLSLNNRCSNTSSMVNANPDMFVPTPPSKKKMH